jgi:hypothetical protein
MAKRTPQAGGFLIVVAIIGGLAWGVFARDPMKGVLIGTVLGIVAAVAVWLADRRRA